MMQKLWLRLFTPVDIASVVFFRVCFGAIMIYEVWRYLSKDWVRMFYISPEFMFKYYGFGWVQPLPGNGMTWLFIGLGVLAFMIMVGAAYRVAAPLFFLGFSYVFLLDQARYLNHFYFVMLLAFLLCFVPAHRAYSIDAWLRPAKRSIHIPGWTLWALLLQMEIVLLYAGIVKIVPDWLQLQPLTMWLARDTDLFLIGPLFEKSWAIAIGAYGAILLHLVGAPLLFWKKTRIYVFVLYCSFHFMNHLVFTIGIFPWLTIVGTTLFFEPDWPRKVGAWLENKAARAMEWRHGLRRGAIAGQLQSTAAMTPGVVSSGRQMLVVGFLGIFLVFQVLIPLRHYLYPGDVAWTEEGHRFAWRMKLRDKSGRVRFEVGDAQSGTLLTVNPRNYLTTKQTRVMACRPDMLLQFAHFLADRLKRNSKVENPEVRVITQCSLNGRRRVALIDPERNLAEVRRSLAPADWLLVNDEPLRPARR